MTAELSKNRANYCALTPIDFLQRAASAFPDHLAIIYQEYRQTYAQTLTRCTQLAGALGKLGFGKNDTIAVMLPNTPPMFECHFGVPMAGCVLCTLNTRLDINALCFCLQHSEAKALIIDSAFANHVDIIKETFPHMLIIQAEDASIKAPQFAQLSYEKLLASGADAPCCQLPEDEWDSITLNYTSGTTGKPRGVVYSHRGAAMNAISNVLDWDIGKHPVYLWTLPMFHCNGWCFPWTIAERAGVNVCLRQVDGELCLNLIREHQVSHYCAAPIVHEIIASAADKPLEHTLKGFVAGAPPSDSLLAKMEQLNIEITHTYGLTEVYGPASICEYRPEWDALEPAERAWQKSRQGLRSHLQAEFDVLRDNHESVTANGEEVGELVFRGNIVMKGYLKNPGDTAKAFAGGYFHTGDLGVKYPDGYIKILDRLKDIIISGGENISSIEIENAIYQLNEVLCCAAVGAPDAKWGEVPVAFIELKKGAELESDAVLAHLRNNLAGYKVPRHIVFAQIPKTSTGKVQKFELRAAAKALAQQHNRQGS